jgi:hypothetical protein
VAVEVCYSGPQKDAERALEPLRKVGKPETDTIGTRDYEVVQRMNDMGDSRSVGSYLKGGFISELPTSCCPTLSTIFRAVRAA